MGYVALVRCCAGGTATFAPGTRLDTAYVDAMSDGDDLLLACAIKRVDDALIPAWLVAFADGGLDLRGEPLV